MGRARKRSRTEAAAREASEARAQAPSSGRRRGWWLAVALVAGAAGGRAIFASRGIAPTLPRDASALAPEVARAIDLCVAAVRASPGVGKLHGELAIQYEANGLWPEALESYTHAFELDSDQPGWLYHRATAELELGQSDRARASLERATAKFPSFAPAAHRLGLLALESGDLAAAERAFLAALHAAPDAAEPHAGLGDVQLRKGDTASAIASLRRAIELDPGLKQAHYLLGRALVRTGDEAAAQRELALGVDARPRVMFDEVTARVQAAASTSDARLKRVTDLVDAGDYLGAQRLLEQVLAEHPDDVTALVNLGVVFNYQRHPELAIPKFQRAAALAPDNSVLHMNFAASLLDCRRSAEALVEIDRAIQLDPRVAHAHFVRSAVLESQSQWNAALESIGRAIQLEPANVAWLEQLARLQREAGRLDEALKSYERLTALTPERWQPWADVHRIAAELSDYGRAAAALAKARAIAPNEPALAELARQYAASGH